MVVSSDFQRLRVYRLAVDLSDEIYASVERWPLLARTSFGAQLIRSADSIGANIAEASGRYGPADRRRLLVIARGSLYERSTGSCELKNVAWRLTARRSVWMR